MSISVGLPNYAVTFRESFALASNMKNPGGTFRVSFTLILHSHFVNYIIVNVTMMNTFKILCIMHYTNNINLRFISFYFTNESIFMHY